MKRSIALSFFCIVVSIAQGQEFSSELFHEGFLVTNKNDTLRGALKYDMQQNIVHMIDGGKVKTYTSQKIFYFEIYDVTVDNFRQFYSLPYKVGMNYKIPILFELQYEGPLSLMTREAIVQETVPSTGTYWGGSYTQLRLVYSFFFVDKKGNIVQYLGRKKELYSLMRDKSKYLKEYMKEYKLQVDEIQDLIRITAFYNSI